MCMLWSYPQIEGVDNFWEGWNAPFALCYRTAGSSAALRDDKQKERQRQRSKV